MILFRLREFGSAEWTEICLDGDLEEFAGTALAGCLTENTSLHLQKRVEGTWEDFELV